MAEGLEQDEQDAETIKHALQDAEAVEIKQVTNISHGACNNEPIRRGRQFMVVVCAAEPKAGKERGCGQISATR